jgi:small subunit ribosomal protein S2
MAISKLSQQEMLDAGVHFGHLKKKWNPKMLPYIFMERKGIHIIDLNKTQEKLEEAAAALRSIAKSGRKILFVATKETSERNCSGSSKTGKHAFRYRALVRWYVDELRYYP